MDSLDSQTSSEYIQLMNSQISDVTTSDEQQDSTTITFTPEQTEVLSNIVNDITSMIMENEDLKDNTELI